MQAFCSRVNTGLTYNISLLLYTNPIIVMGLLKSYCNLIVNIGKQHLAL